MSLSIFKNYGKIDSNVGILNIWSSHGSGSNYIQSSTTITISIH